MTAKPRELFAEYESNVKIQAQELLQALNQLDRLKAEEMAHKIKGSSRSVGALALAGVCQSIEAEIRDADQLTVDKFKEEVSDNLEQLMPLLAQV